MKKSTHFSTCTFCFFFFTLVLMANVPFNAFAAAEKWQFACTFRSSAAGYDYEEGSDESIEDAKSKAESTCNRRRGDVEHVWYGIRNGESSCSLTSCREPLECASTSHPDLNIRRRALECELNKLKSARRARAIKANEIVNEKIREKFGAEKLIAIEKARISTFTSQTNSVFAGTFQELAKEFSSLMNTFSTKYVPSYSNLSKAMTDWARFSDSAKWQELVKVKFDLDASLALEFEAAMKYEFAGRLLQSKISNHCNAYRVAMNPFSAFWESQDQPVRQPDSICVKAKNKLSEVVNYSSNRYIKILGAGQTLRASILKRIEALQALEIDESLRKSRALASDLSSANSFLVKISTVTSELWAENEKAISFDLPYLGKQFTKLKAYAGYVQMCNTSATTLKWMETGCLQVQRNAKVVEKYIAESIPRNIKFGLAEISSDFPDLQVDKRIKILKDLETGSVEQAVLGYDSLLLAGKGQLP